MNRERIKKLLEQRRTIWEQMSTILKDAESREDGLAGEPLEAYQRAEVDFDKVSKELETRQRHDGFETALRQPVDPGVAPENREDPAPNGEPEQRYGKVFDAYVRNGFNGIEPEERALLRQAATDPNGLTPTERRDLGVATGGAGGFLVPQGFLVKLTEVLKYFGPIRQLANRIETASGNDMPWPNNDDTANVGAILGENAAVTTQDVVLTSKTLKAFMYTSLLVKASWQLLNDTAFDVESFLTRKLGQRIGRIQNTHFTTGSGAGQPEGIITNMTVGVTLATGNTLTLTYGGLVDLVHSINYAYRQPGVGGGTPGPGGGGATGAAFQASDAAVAAARKIVDTQGRPIWTMDVTGNDPDRLLGYPVYVNSDMAAPAANAKSIAFGDWNSYYIVRDVVGATLVRLDERYADQLQVGFFMFLRGDGRVDDVAAAKVLVHSAT